MGGTVTANFLVRHADGDYQLKKEPEEVEQELIFMQDVKVVWKGLGRFHIENEKEVNARLAEHWQSRHMRHEVSLISLPEVSAKSSGKRNWLIKVPQKRGTDILTTEMSNNLVLCHTAVQISSFPTRLKPVTLKALQMSK